MHGWGSHAARFANFVAPLRAAGFSVIGIDAPAHGTSPGRFSDLPRFRDSLAEVLRAHEPIHAVIGHSLGGLVALHLALAQRDRVRSLALLCTFADGRIPTRLTPAMIWMAGFFDRR